MQERFLPAGIPGGRSVLLRMKPEKRVAAQLEGWRKNPRRWPGRRRLLRS